MQQSSVKHNPLTFYLRLLLYMFVALIIRAVALAPLLALHAFPQGSPWRWLAALTPALLLFFVLPQRFSFAEALVQKSRSRYFSFDQALSMKGYGEKLLEALLHALNVLKWALPLLAMGYYAYYCKDNVDAKTLMVALISMGKTASNIVYAVSSFFVSLLGHIPTPQVAGGLMEGVYVVLGILGIGVIILLIGMVRNSATRYIWVVAEREERPVRTEVRRRLRGRRWRQLGVGLCNLVLWAPFLAVLAMTLKSVLGDLSTQVMLLMAGGAGGSLSLADALKPVAAAFLLLYMPLLPARRILTAAFATHNVRHAAPAKPEAAPAQPQSAAYIPDWVKAANEETEPAAAASIAPSFAESAAEQAPGLAMAVPVTDAAHVMENAPAAEAEAEITAEPEAAPTPVEQPETEQPAPVAEAAPVPAEQPAEQSAPVAAQPEAMPEEPPAAPAEEPAPYGEQPLYAQPEEATEADQPVFDSEEHFYSPDEDEEPEERPVSDYRPGLDA